MAQRSAKAVAAVERALKADKNADRDKLRAVAEKADAAIKKLDNRQFNASYVLAAKRTLGLTRKPSQRRKAAKKRARTTASKPLRRGLTGRARARQLVQQRDKQVQAILVKGSNQDAAYELGASVDDYLDRIQEALRS